MSDTRRYHSRSARRQDVLLRRSQRPRVSDDRRSAGDHFRRCERPATVHHPWHSRGLCEHIDGEYRTRRSRAGLERDDHQAQAVRARGRKTNRQGDSVSSIAQTRSTHRRFIPMWHFFALPVLAINVIVLAVRFVRAPTGPNGWNVIVAVALVIGIFLSRAMPL